MEVLIKKIQDKKQSGVEQQAINLGLVQTLSKQLTANELAAKGIKLSIRDSVIQFIKREMDQTQSQTKDVQNLLSVLESDKLQRADITVNDNDPSSGLVVQQQEPIDGQQTQQAVPLMKKQSTTVTERQLPSVSDKHDEEESGLLFVNPDEERRARLEKEKQLKKKEVPMLKLKDGSHAMMLPALVATSSVTSNTSGGGVNQAGSRSFIQNLKNAQI